MGLEVGVSATENSAAEVPPSNVCVILVLTGFHSINKYCPGVFSDSSNTRTSTFFISSSLYPPAAPVIEREMGEGISTSGIVRANGILTPVPLGEFVYSSSTQPVSQIAATKVYRRKLLLSTKDIYFIIIRLLFLKRNLSFTTAERSMSPLYPDYRHSYYSLSA